MKKFVYKFLAVVVSFVTAIAMIPLSNGSVAYAETDQVTSNVKYFSTTMYNFDKTKFNQATDTAIGIDKITGWNSDSKKKQARQDGFYFINDNNEKWAAGQVNKCNSGDGNNNVLVQGIVENTLDSKGNIQFNYPNAGVFASPETNINGRDVYQNVQFPFVYDSTTGYYEFNSDNNHVHSGKLDGETLNLYSRSQTINKQGTFFPFNNDNDSSADYHFGMNMSVPFYMSESGKDQNNNDMKFEFSGDDDVWVFINGKLVLDIGGIHAAIGGSIDFATGEVKYTFGNRGKVYAAQGKDGKQTEIQDKTYNLYSDFGITREELASGENNLQIFYLERGAGKSNCKIKFNLQQKDTLEVSKTLGTDTPYTENNFEFQLLKKNSNGEYEAVSNEKYALYNGSSLISNTTKTDENGKFNLQAGQHANFSGTGKDGSEYKVVELTDGYTTTWTGMKENVTNGSTVSGENAYIVPISKNDQGGVTKYTVNCVNTAGVVLNDDTIVLDYGKPVEYNVRTNDNNSSQNASVYGIGEGSLAKDSTSANGYATLDTNVALDNGNIKINQNGVVTYTPTRYMNSVDKANYAVQYQVTTDDENQPTTTKYAYATVNVLPATSVYYEDDFGSDDNTDSNVAIVWTGSWKKVPENSQKDNSTQDSSNGLANGGDYGYGWDSSYVDDTGFSNGSAHESSTAGSRARFTFKGTGVDVYSKTSGSVGLIRAQLYKDDSKSAMKTVYIDNISESGDYYQIPTLSFDGLEYGTYTVKITVLPATEKADGSATRGTYYLDGIRVYNPLGTVGANSIAGKAYKEANESNAQYIQVRKDLLDSNKVQAINTAIQGSLFIDKSANKVGDRSDSIGTYRDYGPKNEVYLKKDQGVAFTINGYNSNKNKVFIGLKSPTGQSVRVKVTSGSKIDYITLSSASDLYYEIKPDSNGNVVIENMPDQNMSDNLLSITKVRITTQNSINGVSANYSLTSSPELMSYVNSFDTLQEEQDTTQKDTEDTLDKGDVDIDNPSDNNTNTDNDKQDNNNQQNQSNNIWNKIISSIKGWFRR